MLCNYTLSIISNLLFVIVCVCVCFLTTLHPLHSQNNIFIAVICQWKMINSLNNLLWDSSECREYKLHFFSFFLFCFAFFFVYSSFFPSPIWHSSCLTDIGAHKLWLLAQFAMCAYLMYYISSDINNDEYCVYDLMYLCIYYMAIKFFHCHCHCHYSIDWDHVTHKPMLTGTLLKMDTSLKYEIQCKDFLSGKCIWKCCPHDYKKKILCPIF